MIFIVSPSPTIQRTMFFSSFKTGKVNRAISVFTHASGKGLNVARTLKALRKESTVLTHAGGSFKNIFLNLAKNEGLSLNIVPSSAEVRICTTIVEDGRTTELVEEAEKVSFDTEKKLIKKGLAILKKSELLIISGKPAKGYSENVYKDLFKAAKNKNIPVIVDTRGPYLEPLLKEGGFLLKINKDEFIETFFPENNKVSETIIAEKITELYKHNKIISVITDGKNDVMFFSPDIGIKRLSPPLVTSINTTGCGDAFTAALSSALQNRKDMETVCNFAVSIASRAASSMIPGGLP
ncbi:PfkB family carbohydrate kinase [Spirochaetia bacterium 38H-sp]|uniref:PfkB family carbohydrate kinase n=1 Tax=Rarispira pelagica TaxID=3141764 RepID=A0ABU9UBI6_9SPIR